ncbi:MAG: UDP-N-acetylmuramoyl-L-alanine--D-glutamate ligase [Salinibacterium sp.]|nr:UDP-N-acetylmuramoyl-L-alanine--D-glutamate ligase [Salinibacterium sp.]
MGVPIAVRDLDELTSWHAEWSGLRVAVLGLGATGLAVTDTLRELGAEVLVLAAEATEERAAIVEVVGARLVLDAGDTAADGEAETALEKHDPELFVVSPGYSPNHRRIVWARDRGIPIWGDIELAWRLRDKLGEPAGWIVVTGTNGKTTTAQLAEHVLRGAGLRAAAVGNIGVPVLDALRHPDGFDVLVVELSSFQLHWLRRAGVGALHPIASVCLNLANDHLDWHGSAEAYREAKATVYWNTKVACVYNKADRATIAMVEDAEVQDGARAIGFGLDTPGPSDFGVVDGILLDRAFGDDRHRAALELTTVAELGEAGLASPHNVLNVLAACALARAAGVPITSVRESLGSFRLDHHRTEAVAFAREILWVNDSKATNPHAAEAALRSFDSVVWVVGGLLKGVDINSLVEANAKRLRAAVVIGIDREAVLSAFARHAPEVAVLEVSASQTDQVMLEAVRLAGGVAFPGDVVLLAPAAASMDQFIDYADRGRRFAAAVTQYLGGEDGAEDNRT